MFEMLGNWSFGDYFKKESIEWSWELLIDVYGLPIDRLYVTVFEGDAADGLEPDEEAYGFWKGIVAEDKILRCSKKDNFWEMGEQGPCGPSSEIHIDMRPQSEIDVLPGAELVNADHEQVIEIWNLVFVEYNRKANGSLEALPAKHVDTGMGFERLCRVIQGKSSNYETDIFMPLINEVEKLSGVAYGKELQKDIAIRVIVDHVRALTFAIADGQLPSNTGAGYVIRRILRRAIRYGFTFLKQDEAFIYQLVNILSDQFETVFPEVSSQ
jgi:alanyl-tRNA synthetase